MITKKTMSAMLCFILGGGTVLAQAFFPETQYLDINKFRIGHMVHGDMWYDLPSSNPSCEFPKGSGKHASYMGSLWAVGIDAGKDFVTAQMYRSKGIDYWPGPLDASGASPYPSSVKWARIWKVSQSDIETFKKLSVKTVATVPKDILEWPAKGSVYAKGNAGATLSITDDMAPFIDVDADGKYDPMKGDYPKIKGDQMLWWVINDNGDLHTSSKGTALKLDYYASAYAYSRGSAVDNMVFYEFEMHNKSSIRYADFRFGLFSDADLGSPFDDYIAFDSSHRMGIVYNARIPDAPNGKNSYGDHPPLVGVSFVHMPGDVYPGAMLPAGTFNYFENSNVGSLRDPKAAVEFKNYMYGKDADGNPRYFGNYAFPITKGAIQCDSAYPFKDQRFLTTTGNYAFQPGITEVVAMVLLATDTTGNACPGVDFKPLTDLADTAWKIYYNPLPPLSIQDIVALDKKLRIYPNPASQQLFIDSYTGRSLQAGALKVYDLNGRVVTAPVSQQGKQAVVDISNLASGVYSIRYDDGTTQVTQRFVKR